MATLGLSYENDALVERLIVQTGQRANLITITCNEILKHIDPRQRVITPEMVEQATGSFNIDSALEGWGQLSGDADASRLDRIVVYATIEQGGFTRQELDQRFEKLGFSPPDEGLRQSLRRLELAYVLGREGKRYVFQVPLFAQRILEEEPATRLANELREAGSG